MKNGKSINKRPNIKVKYIGRETVAIDYDKIYEVISIEEGWYRIMTKIGDYLFPPECFEIVDKKETNQKR